MGIRTGCPNWEERLKSKVAGIPASFSVELQEGILLRNCFRIVSVISVIVATYYIHQPIGLISILFRYDFFVVISFSNQS
jgi:hypothetical protein